MTLNLKGEIAAAFFQQLRFLFCFVTFPAVSSSVRIKMLADPWLCAKTRARWISGRFQCPSKLPSGKGIRQLGLGISSASFFRVAGTTQWWCPPCRRHARSLKWLRYARHPYRESIYLRRAWQKSGRLAFRADKWVLSSSGTTGSWCGVRGGRQAHNPSPVRAVFRKNNSAAPDGSYLDQLAVVICLGKSKQSEGRPPRV